MSKKHSKYSKDKDAHITNLKLICATILFVLFLLSIIFVFHYTDIDKGGIEILNNLRNPWFYRISITLWNLKKITVSIYLYCCFWLYFRCSLIIIILILQLQNIRYFLFYRCLYFLQVFITPCLQILSKTGL